MPPFSDSWKFIRTCQECGHQQMGKDPATYIDKAGKEPWRDVKCKRCGNDSLDYGSKRPTTPEEIVELDAYYAKQGDL